MPVRTCACDAESLSCRDEGLALEGAFDDLDDVRGKMGEVAEGLMSDGLSLANGPSEQMGDLATRGRRPALRRRTSERSRWPLDPNCLRARITEHSAEE